MIRHTTPCTFLAFLASPPLRPVEQTGSVAREGTRD
jgi:hypothetical protein